MNYEEGRFLLDGYSDGERDSVNHVFVEHGNGWRMVAAQGTQITERPVMAL